MSERPPRNRAERRARRHAQKTGAVRAWKRAMKGVHAPEQIMAMGRTRR